MNKIRVFEAFSGIGAQAMALKRLQVDYPDVVEFEFVGTSEIEPSAIKAYNAVHGDVKCYGDITKIDWNEVPDFDLFTMSSPCQDFSVAGRQAGAEEGSGTRSSLLWECRKAIIAKRPKYVLFENVSAVVSKKFIRGFNKWQAELESYGYANYAKVLNSKDFGIPQNRERIFMVSILGGQSYHFPKPFKLEKRIKDILEPYGTVDESFYFKPEQLLRITAPCDRKDKESGIEIFGMCNVSQDGIIVTEDSVSKCLCIGHNNRPKVAERIIGPALQQRLSLYGNNAQAGRVYDVDGIAPCLDTCCGGNRMPKIMESVDRQSKIRSKVMPNGNIRFYQDDESKSDISEMQIIHPDNECPTITTAHVPKILELAIIQRPHGFNAGGEFSESAPTVTTSSWEHNNLCKEPMYARLRETLERADLKNKDSVISDEYNKVIYDDIAPTITTRVNAGIVHLIERQSFVLEGHHDKMVLKDADGKGYLWQDGGLWRVRKLVPIEVFRLQDVSDEDAKKIIAVCSKSVCYQLAGNSITTNVIYHIFRKLWINPENESTQKSLFDL